MGGVRAPPRPKPLLVGEAPSRTSDPDRPFSGRSGDRLRDLLGAPLEDVFRVRNLLDTWPGPGNGKGSGWDADAARERALEVFDEIERGVPTVFVGRRVARAFGHPYDYLDVVGVAYPMVVVPHPSGVNRWWNDAANEARAKALLRSLR